MAKQWDADGDEGHQADLIVPPVEGAQEATDKDAAGDKGDDLDCNDAGFQFWGCDWIF